MDGHVILYQSEAKSVSERDRFDARRPAPRKFSHSADTTPASKGMANCGSPDAITNARPQSADSEQRRALHPSDRTTVVYGKSVQVSVDLGVARTIKKKQNNRAVL